MSIYRFLDFKLLYLVLLVALSFSGVSAQASDRFSGKHYGKPHAPVDIQYKIEEQALNNQQIVISFSNLIDVEDLLVGIRLGDGLQSADLLPQYNFGVLAKQSISKISFNVSASSDGNYRVYVYAKLLSSGASQARTFIVPITIGEPPVTISKSRSNVVIDSVGKRIISMPATATSVSKN